MDFEIIILVVTLMALVVVFSVFLAFLAYLAFFKFCSFMDCKSGEASSTFYQVEEVEKNILTSFQNLINQVSSPSSRSRSSSTTSSSTNSSSSSSSGFHSNSRGSVRGGAEWEIVPPPLMRNQVLSPEYEDISDPENEE